MSTLAVGQPYRHGRTSWPETLQAYIGPTYCELTSFYNGPTSSEIAAYHSGPVAFALAVAGPHVLVIAVQYGDLPWVDMPFEVHRIDPAGRGVPAGDPYERCGSGPCWSMQAPCMPSASTRLRGSSHAGCAPQCGNS